MKRVYLERDRARCSTTGESSRDTGGRGVSCTFRLIVKRLIRKGHRWFPVHDTRVIKDDPPRPRTIHVNHIGSLKLSHHPVHHRRTPAELAVITSLTNLHLRPKAIPKALKVTSDTLGFCVRRKDIYNERLKIKRKVLAGKTSTQALVFILEQKEKEPAK